MGKSLSGVIRILLALWLVLAWSFIGVGQVSGRAVTVKAVVEKQEVYVGESFLLQIQVEGEDAPLEPDLSGLQDFTVQQRGGQQNNSESISIVNGQMSRVSRRGYIFNFSLTPNRAGVLDIPALGVVVDGETHLTSPLTVRAREVAENDDFKLRLSVSRENCYVNEPVILTVKWYIGRDVKGFDFNLPLLADERFVFADLPPEDQGGKRELITVPMATGNVTAWKDREKLDGTESLTVSFRKIMIPQVDGRLRLARGTVNCQAVVGYQQGRSRSPFDDIFNNDFFGRSRNEVLQTFITPSNEISLQVKPLPLAGQPPAFTGLVGVYRLEAEAEPLTVNVGDPITLRLSVSGPPYLDNVTLPPLKSYEVLARNFKIPAEMAPGEVQGTVKRFVQTIRANNPAVGEIPALSLDYFNPENGRYEVARSAVIPLTVRAARVVTAQDAEGGQDAPALGKRVKGLQQGIDYNYDDPSVLENQEFGVAVWLSSVGWRLLLLAPPGVFLLLFIPTVIGSRRRGRRKTMAAKKAFSELVGACTAIASLDDKSSVNLAVAAEKLLDAVRQYLGLRLGIGPAALTYVDVEERLLAAGVDPDHLRALKMVIDWCEAHHYAGGGGATNGERTEVGRIGRAGRDAFMAIEQILTTERQQG